MNRLSGFADEAANSIDGQIEATRAPGWSCIEARGVDGVNMHDLSDADFDVVRRKLDAAGIRVNCFGSTIANWSKSVDETRAVVERAIRRLREICSRFLDAGLTPVHENCMDYGGMSWEHSLEMLAAVPGLKLVYDTGNPGITPDFRKPFPYPNQDARECYEKLRDHVVHVHIKDGVRDPETGEERYFFPDEGVCDVGGIVEDLLRNGYGGDFSIEPRMAVVFHDAGVSASDRARFDNYVDYGRRFERLLDAARRQSHSL